MLNMQFNVCIIYNSQMYLKFNGKLKRIKRMLKNEHALEYNNMQKYFNRNYILVSSCTNVQRIQSYCKPYNYSIWFPDDASVKRCMLIGNGGPVNVEQRFWQE